MFLFSTEYPSFHGRASRLPGSVADQLLPVSVRKSWSLEGVLLALNYCLLLDLPMRLIIVVLGKLVVLEEGVCG